DLSRQRLRQRGIQEIDGVAIARPITVNATLIEDVIDQARFTALAEAGSHGRKGPVFLELPLDVQGRDVDPTTMDRPAGKAAPANLGVGPPDAELARLAAALREAQRPVLLLGGGVSRAVARSASAAWALMGIPVTTTWNGADRIAADHPL